MSVRIPVWQAWFSQAKVAKAKNQNNTIQIFNLKEYQQVKVR
jgi:hypothetical protein